MLIQRVALGLTRLPIFLRGMTWVDLRVTEAGIERLIWVSPVAGRTHRTSRDSYARKATDHPFVRASADKWVSSGSGLGPGCQVRNGLGL
jgi:hypothetical protein